MKPKKNPRRSSTKAVANLSTAGKVAVGVAAAIVVPFVLVAAVGIYGLRKMNSANSPAIGA